jgi:hypothetical protein
MSNLKKQCTLILVAFKFIQATNQSNNKQCVWMHLAVSRPSVCIKINVSYRETHASAAGWFEPITNVLNHSLFIVFNEIKNLILNM